MSAATVHALATPETELRLTRRGRLVALVGFVALLFALLGVWSAGSAAAPAEGDLEPTRAVVVTPGLTLWEIAADARPAADPRATIEAILDLNGLSPPAQLQVGQRLAVPVG